MESLKPEMPGGVVKELLFSLFENVISFNTADSTARCEKITPVLNFLPQSPVRVITEDFLPLIEEHFVFDGGTAASLLNGDGEDNSNINYINFSFGIVINGIRVPYMGVRVRLDDCVLLCFNGVEDAMRVFRITPDEPVEPIKAESPGKNPGGVFVKTFGFFDVFKNGSAVCFHCEKAKELLALLVDRRGGFISSADGARLLWPDEEPGEKQRARFRKTAMRLTEHLKENGIENIIETIHGRHRIVAENFECDLYSYLSGGKKGGFHGAYMSNYAWGGEAGAMLAGDKPD